MTTGLANGEVRRLRRALLGLAVAGALVAGAAAAMGGCFVGASYEKVASVGGQGGAGGGGVGGAGGAGGACTPTPGVCDQGAALRLSGSADVVVTDVARVANTSLVLVGHFSGTFTPPGGPQLSTAGESDGFLLELDNGGNYLAHLLLPEADEASTLKVAVDPNTTDVVVAATVTEGPFAACSSSQEILVWRLGYTQMDGYTTRYLNGAPFACIDVGDTTELTMTDVVIYPGTEFITVVGSFDGTLAGVSSTAVDGFGIGVEEDAVVGTPFLVGGSGDAYVAGALPSFDHYETVLVGDFSGDMVVAVPNLMPVPRTAEGGSDLFVIAYDGNTEFPNLDVYTFGHEAGYHQAVDLAYIPTMTAQAVMLAKLDGPIFLDQNYNTQEGSAALALTFTVPVDSNSTPFGLVDVHLLRAPEILPLALGGNANQFFIAGHARGDITVEHGGGVLGTISAGGCQLDAFLVNLQGGVMTQEQRCGDGGQQVVAASARQGGHVIAVQVPPGSALDSGAGEPAVEGGIDTFLLLQ